jgi:hypothetical protein
MALVQELPLIRAVRTGGASVFLVGVLLVGVPWWGCQCLLGVAPESGPDAAWILQQPRGRDEKDGCLGVKAALFWLITRPILATEMRLAASGHTSPLAGMPATLSWCW